jgi:hypothetical protein
VSDETDTCKFGHTFEPKGGSDVQKQIVNGDISSLDDVRDEKGTDLLASLFDDHWKKMKISAGSTGTPYGIILGAVDKLDTDLGYSVEKSVEKIFVAPQNQMHQSFRQRRQEAEQRVKETMRSLQEQIKQKHMLEHDVRKLRSRAEAIDSHDETQLKSDFVELVDGAGAAGGQGGDEASLKFLRDQNFYPSIVADFNEMDSLDDLKEADQRDDDKDGKLADRPENVKAILKKKYTMYQRWKDLYGSEINRKLNELKGQLRSVERSIEETKEWLQPYIKDMVMIDQKDTSDYYNEMTKYYTLQGFASMTRNLEFICYKPLEKEEGELVVADSAEHATHYRVVYVQGVHVNLAPGSQPQNPADGPTTGIVFWYPAIVCKHVFENIFQEKINIQKNKFDELMEKYTGDFKTEEGEKFKEARHEKELSVRELREEIEEEVEGRVPVEVSSKIRRIEDGLDEPEVLGDYLEVAEEILDIELSEESEGKEDEMYDGLERQLRLFTGETDDYYLGGEAGNELSELVSELRFNYYYDFKIGNGLHTMK